MLLTLLSLVIYCVLAIATSKLLLSLSVPLVLLILYMLPLIINLLVYNFQKKELKTLNSFILPTNSVAFYFLFAYLTSLNGTWKTFAQNNTMTDANMSVEVTTNLFTGSQVLFILVLFYGVSLTYHFISQKISNQGV